MNGPLDQWIICVFTKFCQNFSKHLSNIYLIACAPVQLNVIIYAIVRNALSSCTPIRETVVMTPAKQSPGVHAVQKSGYNGRMQSCALCVRRGQGQPRRSHNPERSWGSGMGVNGGDGTMKQWGFTACCTTPWCTNLFGAGLCCWFKCITINNKLLKPFYSRLS